VALLLGRLELSVPAAIDIYAALAKSVFIEKNWFLRDGKFKALNLELAIKSAVEQALGKGHSDEKMLDERSGTEVCKVFVCATKAAFINAPAGPSYFRTYAVPRNATPNCAIWEAGRATSAAPTFFERILIGPPERPQPYIDGGVGYNNPVVQVLEEAELTFGSERETSCIISIGTGWTSAIKYGPPSLTERVVPAKLAKALADIATDCEKTAEAMERKFKNTSGVYWRLNVDTGLDKIALEDWEELGNVEGYTEEYMRKRGVSESIDKIVDVLTAHEPGVSRSLDLVRRKPGQGQREADFLKMLQGSPDYGSKVSGSFRPLHTIGQLQCM